MSEPYTPSTDEPTPFAEPVRDIAWLEERFVSLGINTTPEQDEQGRGLFRQIIAAHDESVRAEARAEAEAERDELDGANIEIIERTESHWRKALAERDELAAVIEKVRDVIHTPAMAWRVAKVLEGTPADLLSERDARMRAEGAKQALLDAAEAARNEWSMAYLSFVHDWLSARAERFPAPHDTEVKCDDK